MQDEAYAYYEFMIQVVPTFDDLHCHLEDTRSDLQAQYERIDILQRNMLKIKKIQRIIFTNQRAALNSIKEKQNRRKVIVQ